MTKVRQTFQISLTDVNCACAVFIRFELSLKLTPPPPRPTPTIFLIALWRICGGSNRQLLAVSWLVDCFGYVYQVVGEMI